MRSDGHGSDPMKPMFRAMNVKDQLFLKNVFQGTSKKHMNLIHGQFEE